MTEKPTYPELTEYASKWVNIFHDQYLIKHYHGATPRNMKRSFANFYRRKLAAVPPDKSNSWGLEFLQATIDRGVLDGIPHATLNDERKAVKAWFIYQSDRAERSGKPRWIDHTQGLVLPDPPAVTPGKKQPKGEDLFVTITKAEDRHLRRRAGEMDVTRQVVVHQLLERDMKRDELLTGKKLLDASHKQHKETIDEALDEVKDELRVLRALLEKLIGDRK